LTRSTSSTTSSSSSLPCNSYTSSSQSVTSLSLIPHGSLRNETVATSTASPQQQQHHLPTGGCGVKEYPPTRHDNCEFLS
jgi:hypothetical protein